MTNKDFLEQFSNSNKPDSFKEEERVKIDNHKRINIKAIVIVLISLLLVAGAVLFFLLRPTIEVKNFVGGNISDVEAWVRQNDIETKGIIVRKEYNFDNDENIVVSQSIDAGKKVRKDVKIDFVVSLGANPDEQIRIPDLMSMNKSEISKWISDNKLTKTKITSVYSEEFEVDSVISYELKNVEEDSFTRASTLNINISKGPQPAGTVVVSDFLNKYYAEAETWAKQNKIELKRVNNYSDSVEKDLIISQSVEAKKEMKEGETLTVYVSLGKAVYAKSLIGLSIEDVEYWAENNKIELIEKQIYSNNYDENTIISQSIEEGKIVKDEMIVEVSLGIPKFDINEGKSYQELKEWINDVNKKGANIAKGTKTEKNSDTVPVGNVISTNLIRVGATLDPVISIGKNIYLNSVDWNECVNDRGCVKENVDESKIRQICEKYNDVNFEFVYESYSREGVSNVISIERSDGKAFRPNTYISQNVTVIIRINEGY